MQHEIPLSLSAERAHGELVDEAFLRAFATEVGVEVHDLTTAVQDGEQVASMVWSFATDRPGIPSVARKLLPGDVRLRWSQWWGPLTDDRATGRLEVVLMGTPSATSTGQCELRGNGSGATLSTNTSTKAKLPWGMAGPIEGRIDKDLVGWILSVQARVLERRSAG